MKIRNVYQSLPNPAAFSGIQQLKKSFPNATKKNLIDQLTKIDVYSRHKIPQKITHNPYYIHRLRQLLEADLLDRSHPSFQRFNRPYSYYLLVIDVFSRYIWMRPLKTKTSNEVSLALDSILNSMPNVDKVERLLTDKGNEFRGKPTLDVLRKYNIKLTHPNYHASFIERANRSINMYTGKYMTAFQTKNFSKAMNAIIEAYNNRFHQSIQMTPAQAEDPQNSFLVRLANSEKYAKFDNMKKKKKSKFKIGDFVRLKINRSKFHRSFHPTFGAELYIIHKILKNLAVPMFLIRDFNGYVLPSRFYQEEIVHANISPFKPEKIVLRRMNPSNGKREFKIKWVGLPDNFNSFVSEEDYNKLVNWHRRGMIE